MLEGHLDQSSEDKPIEIQEQHADSVDKQHLEKFDREVKKHAPDFFISFTEKDIKAAEKVARVLNEYGQEVFFQPWSMRPGMDWYYEMMIGAKRSKKMIVILSEEYLTHSDHGLTEVLVKLRRDTLGANRSMIPIKIEDFDTDIDRYVFFEGKVYVDVTGVEEEKWEKMILDGIFDRNIPEKGSKSINILYQDLNTGKLEVKTMEEVTRIIVQGDYIAGDKISGENVFTGNVEVSGDFSIGGRGGDKKKSENDDMEG